MQKKVAAAAVKTEAEKKRRCHGPDCSGELKDCGGGITTCSTCQTVFQNGKFFGKLASE